MGLRVSMAALRLSYNLFERKISYGLDPSRGRGKAKNRFETAVYRRADLGGGA
jgi:hypothetical protein